MDANHRKKSRKLQTYTLQTSIEDYSLFIILTKLEYRAGLIKEPITSELLRFTTRRILSQILDDQIYRYLEQELELKKDLNNQQ